MSSVRRRKDARTYFLDLRENGRRLNISLKTTDRNLARARAERILNDRGILPFATSSMKLYRFIEHYTDWAKTRKHPGTFRNEEIVLERLKSEFSDRYLRDIVPLDMDRFISHLKKKPTKKHPELVREMSPAGKNFYIRTLRGVFSQAVRWGMCSDNPFSKMRRLSEEKKPPRILKRREVRAFFKTLRKVEPEYLDLFTVYLDTGMRRNEVLQLEWKDVDFEEGTITIRKAKGNKYRIIPLWDVSRKLLKRRLRAGYRNLRKPFEMHADTPSKVFRRIAKLAGLTGVTLHDLRKTYGTMLAGMGINSLFIQNWLGHTDPGVTRSHYIGLPEDVRDKMKEFESWAKN